EARALADEHAALARAWGARRPLARALRVRGMTCGGEEGIVSLRESVEVARDSPGRLELAHSLVELGAAERRANRRTAAREPLAEGMSLAHQCGARSLQDRALTELLAAGARPRRPPASGRHPHPERTAHRPPGRHRPDESRDRPAPVHHPED